MSLVITMVIHCNVRSKFGQIERQHRILECIFYHAVVAFRYSHGRVHHKPRVQYEVDSASKIYYFDRYVAQSQNNVCSFTITIFNLS